MVISVTICGESIENVAAQAMKLAAEVLKGGLSPTELPSGGVHEAEIRMEDPRGYCPPGVGRPEDEFAPVDDGTEWDEPAINDWLRSLTSEGREVVKILAQNKVIDPRREFGRLGWSGTRWGGTWIGPRKQARRVKDVRGLKTWPYGHTYYEPRRLWMHPTISAHVLKLLQQEA